MSQAIKLAETTLPDPTTPVTKPKNAARFLGTGLTLTALALLALPAQALGAVSEADLEALRQEMQALAGERQGNLDHVWTMTAACLVFFMQGGFLLLEAGLVRSKNSINVAQKNIADFVIATCAFYLLGFGLMFGPSVGGWFGFGSFAFNQAEDWNFTFFVFQLVFCGTAATILSGAVAERMKFSGYLWATLFACVLVYPIYGHWSWGNLLDGDNRAWLADLGFIDFAGSTVVHSIGGWIALAAAMTIGPRIGRYGPDGKPIPIHGHSAVLATMGALILWIGWIGFNGGSTTVGSGAFAHIISNTMMSAAFGGIVAMALGRYFEGLFRPLWPINGVLAGLVGITAGCDVVDTYGAIAIGMSSGALVFVSSHVIENKLKIDDAIGAVSVHGVCGAWGTIMVGVFALPENLAADDRMSQIMIQALGVGLGFLWAFGTSFVFFKALHKIVGLRVSTEHELEGLNAAEHGTTLGTGMLQKALQGLATGDGDMGKRLDVTTGDESAELALSFNVLMDRLQGLVTDIAANAKRLVQASDQIGQESVMLADLSTSVESKASLVSQSTGNISGSVQSMAGSVGNVTGSVKQISDDASEVSANIDSVSGQVDQMVGAIQEVIDSARQTMDVAGVAKAEASTASASVERLGEASQGITTVVEAIRKIAAQTRMLALNATIESERAGPAGKGFAVVADEVKRLADSTAEATEEIERRVEDIHAGSADVTKVINDMTKIIDSVNSSVEGIGEKADAQIGIANDMARNMDDARARTSVMADQIATVASAAVSASDEARDTASGVHEIHDNIEKVRDVAVRANDSVNAVRDASQGVGRIAQDLGETIGRLGKRPDPAPAE